MWLEGADRQWSRAKRESTSLSEKGENPYNLKNGVSLKKDLQKHLLGESLINLLISMQTGYHLRSILKVK